MRRRWIIRGIFVVPILLCVVGWGWSAGHYAQICYSTRTANFTCLAESGTVVLAGGMGQQGSLGVSTVYYALLSPRFWPAIRVGKGDTDFGDHYYAGFSFEYVHTADDWDIWCGVPYWFLILVFSAVLLVVWRKTRGGVRAIAAFPVEVAAGTNPKQTG